MILGDDREWPLLYIFSWFINIFLQRRKLHCWQISLFNDSNVKKTYTYTKWWTSLKFYGSTFICIISNSRHQHDCLCIFYVYNDIFWYCILSYKIYIKYKLNIYIYHYKFADIVCILRKWCGWVHIDIEFFSQ